MTFTRKFFSLCNALAISMLAAVPYAHAESTRPADHAAQLQQRAAVRAQERADIATAGQALKARQQAAEKACWQRFAVENCLSKVRTAAREEENVLDERELRINREERQEKASERLRAIEQKQREKQAPAPVTATARDGSATLSLEARQTEAQQRAAEQERRVQNHEAAIATQQAEQAQERANALQAQAEKQAAAQARRASKAEDIARRTGTPLPVPAVIPKP